MEGNFAARRTRVLEQLGERGAMLLPAAPELLVGRDTEIRYRADPELYYLTGCADPEAVVLLWPGAEDGPYTLFVRPRDEKEELWTGPRLELEEAAGLYGADAAYPVERIGTRLEEVLREIETLHYRPGNGRPEIDAVVMAGLAASRRTRQRRGLGVRALIDPGAILDEHRLIKDAGELALTREAARLTVEGFRDAVAAIRPGAGEWEVEAALESGFRRRGSEGPAFPTIVASGPNAVILHYVANRRRMAAGELVLLDAGARVGMYNGDVSRTYPTAGRFTAPQRALYDIVVHAHRKAVDTVRPGASEEDVHAAAVHALAEGLVAEGLLQGDPAEIAEERDAYVRFFPHRTSHWLGLEVHDVGDYSIRAEPRPLAPGMVLTVEPALYVPDSEDLAGELRGTGIRLEDDVVVTDDGCDVITSGLPIDADAVEELLAGS